MEAGVTKRFIPTRTADPVPGVRTLGLSGVADAFGVATRIDAGLPATAVGRLAQHLRVSERRVLEVASIPESTFHARKRDRKPLTPEASSRVYRIAKAAEAAEAYFGGDEAAARRWLTQPKVALGGVTPLEFARTPEGSDYVIALLERLEHGVIS
jgi:putative toxin-antitoxin system antitoxin component (TIGR02293 family)